jgi:hypothetical protein
MAYKTYAAKDIGELLDFLAMMMLAAPRFLDKTGYLPHRNIDTVFVALHEGLANVRQDVGRARHKQLVEFSIMMRRHFDADPDDKTGEARRGRQVIHRMEDLLKAALRDQSHK